MGCTKPSAAMPARNAFMLYKSNFARIPLLRMINRYHGLSFGRIQPSPNSIKNAITNCS